MEPQVIFEVSDFEISVTYPREGVAMDCLAKDEAGKEVRLRIEMNYPIFRQRYMQAARFLNLRVIAERAE